MSEQKKLIQKGTLIAGISQLSGFFTQLSDRSRLVVTDLYVAPMVTPPVLEIPPAPPTTADQLQQLEWVNHIITFASEQKTEFYSIAHRTSVQLVRWGGQPDVAIPNCGMFHYKVHWEFSRLPLVIRVLMLPSIGYWPFWTDAVDPFEKGPLTFDGLPVITIIEFEPGRTITPDARFNNADNNNTNRMPVQPTALNNIPSNGLADGQGAYRFPLINFNYELYEI